MGAKKNQNSAMIICNYAVAKIKRHRFTILNLPACLNQLYVASRSLASLTVRSLKTSDIQR